MLPEPQFSTFHFIPDVILRNIRNRQKELVARYRTFVLAPHGAIAENLLLGNFCHTFAIAGVLLIPPTVTRESASPVPLLNAVDAFEGDAILWVGTSPAPGAYARAWESQGKALINLCEGFDPVSYRCQLTEQIVPRLDTDALISPHVEFSMPAWGLGDNLCALSTARAMARMRPDLLIHFNVIPEVVRAFGDDLVTTGKGQRIDIGRPGPMYFFWEAQGDIAGNYAGCYQLSLGMPFDKAPSLDLPRLPPKAGLTPQEYVVIQPRAEGIWGKPHLNALELQRIVDACPLPVVLVGRPGSDTGLRGLDTSHTGSELDMLQVIQHAALVLTPRSASAHVAAGYRVPAVVWVSDDGLDWHLNYPDWPHARIKSTLPAPGAAVIAEMERLLDRPSIHRSLSAPEILFLYCRHWVATLPGETAKSFRSLAAYLLRCLPHPLLIALRSSRFGMHLRVLRERWRIP